MKRSKLLTILLLSFISLSLAAQISKKIFEKVIVITDKEIRFDTLLKVLSRQTGIEFSFNSNKISPSKKLRVNKPKQTLSQWLLILNNSLGLNYRVVGNHIILIEGAKSVSANIQASKQSVIQNKTTTNKKIITNPTQNKNQAKLSQAEIIKVDQSRIESEALDTHNADTNLIAAEDTIKNTTIPSIEPQLVNPTDSKEKISDSTTKNDPSKAPGIIKDVPSGINLVEKEEALQIIGGYNRHGSGDMHGVVFGFEYIRFTSKRFSLSYNFRGMINNEQHTYEYNDASTGINDFTTLKFTTAGIQLGVNAAYSLVKNSNHDLKISLGSFGRYQSDASDGYSFINPAMSNYPIVLVDLMNGTPHKTYSIGGVFQFQYDYTFRNKIYFGFLTGFQTDTNGDAIIPLALVLGKKLAK